MDAHVATTLAGLGFRLAAGYGLTETSPIISFRSAEMRGPGHVGRPLPGVEVRIAAPEAQLEHGEVQARGPNVFAGYLNLPEKTADAFTDDGWFRTGDLGAFDDHGFLHLFGRVSSMIVMPGGENVDPEKVERRLEQSSAIKEAGIVLVDGRLACLVVPGPELTRADPDVDVEQAIRAAVGEVSRNLPSYQRPSQVRLETRPLPRTRLGKLRRRELAARFEELVAAGPESQTSPGLIPRSMLAPLDRELLEDPTAARVWSWLGRRFAAKSISPDTHMQLDLDVDSLAWLGLTLEIRNEIGIDLTDDAVARIELVRDLLQEATSSQSAGQLSDDVLELLRAPDDLLREEDRRTWLEPRGRFYGLIDFIAIAATRVMMRVYFRLDAQGATHLPAKGPFIISANHVSALDPLILVATLGFTRFRQTYWGGWVGILFRNRISRAFSRTMRILPVEPRAGPISNLALAAAVLGRDRILVWFPEGERSRSGETACFRPGVSLLMQASGAPVVPAWIEGAGRALPPGHRVPKPIRLAIRFGEPVGAAELAREGTGATHEERIADALRSRVCALRSAEVDASP
jgi:long-chain acyl-CoA synthetase